MKSSRRILVAEDSEEDAFFLKRAFLKAGVNTRMEFVPDGEMAVGYLSGNGRYGDRENFPLPHLLLLDLKMPRMDGFDVLRWLREQPGLRRIPVVILSSSGEERDVNLAHELGANGYVVKPTGLEGMERLVSAVDRYWLDQHCYPRLQAGLEAD